MTTELRTLQSLRGAVLGTGGVLVLALTLVAYLVTSQVVRPVRRASMTALKLASGQLDERMQVRGTDDLASLARSMNRMAAQLQQRFRELETLSTLQQRFVSDVSHELRTPMTTIKMAADVLYDSRDEMGPTESRSAELMSLEIDRFNTMLADLLEISRFDAGAAVLALDEIDVASLVKAEVAANAGMAQARRRHRGRVRLRRHDGGGRLAPHPAPDPQPHHQRPRARRGKPVQVTVAADDAAVAVIVRDHRGSASRPRTRPGCSTGSGAPIPAAPASSAAPAWVGDLHGGRACTEAG